MRDVGGPLRLVEATLHSQNGFANQGKLDYPFYVRLLRRLVGVAKVAVLGAWQLRGQRALAADNGGLSFQTDGFRSGLRSAIQRGSFDVRIGLRLGEG